LASVIRFIIVLAAQFLFRGGLVIISVITARWTGLIWRWERFRGRLRNWFWHRLRLRRTFGSRRHGRRFWFRGRRRRFWHGLWNGDRIIDRLGRRLGHGLVVR